MKKFYTSDEIKKSMDFATDTLVNVVDTSVTSLAALRDDDDYAGGYVAHIRDLIGAYNGLLIAALSTDDSFCSV